LFFWFIGGSMLIVWLVFHDPAIDLRLVALGSILPDLIDAPFGGARVMHSITAAVALLVVVMLATIGRRAARKRWLALPIGVLLHLALDGVFTSTKIFWWPFTGLGFDDAPLPSLDRGAWNILLELAGLAMCAWLWRQFDLGDPTKRRRFVTEGRVTVA
jgi:membrane-bound metal-dependent hydrolase YbcI (DUF457 family)